MVTISINPELCKHDAICVHVCPESVFIQHDKDSVPEIVAQDLCISCGQCVAICPGGAISHNDFPEGWIHDIETDAKPSYEQLMAILRYRRSQRFFKDKTVDKDLINKIIEAARYAPSALNSQSTKYLVIQDVLFLTEIAETTTDVLKGIIDNLRKTHAEADLVRDHSFKVISQKIDEIRDMGDDIFLHNASTLLLFYADKNESMGAINANLAVQNALLAAEALGIGAFYTGFVFFAIRHDPEFKKIFNLPENHEIFASIALGYPQVKFRKWIERKPADIVWR